MIGNILIINNKKSTNDIATLLSVYVKKYAIINSSKDIIRVNIIPEIIIWVGDIGQFKIKLLLYFSIL